MVHALAAASVGALLLLAGCSGGTDEGPTNPDGRSVPCRGPGPANGLEGDSPDVSKETLTWYVNGTGSWSVVLPYVAHPRVTPEMWVANMTPELGSFTLTGAGNKVQSSCISIVSVRTNESCCAEEFLDGEWAGGTRNMAPIRVVSGNIHIDVLYSARSNYCGGDGKGSASFGPGVHTMEIERGIWCT